MNYNISLAKRTIFIAIIFSMSLVACLAFFTDNVSAATYEVGSTSELNQAITKVKSDGGGIINLKGSTTYLISNTINLDSNTVLTGDRSAVIKLVPNAQLSQNVPLITAPSGSKNIKITGFTIDGNSEAQNVKLGGGYHNMIYFDSATNVEVSNMRLEWGSGDGFKVNRCSDIRFTNNDVYKLGHDAFYTTNSCSNGVISGNSVITRTNSAFRLSGGATDFKITDNSIDGELRRDATGPGIEIDKSSTASNTFNNIEISNNKLSNLCGSGIWIYSAYPSDSEIRAQGVTISNNQFENVGQYGEENGRSNYGILLQNFDNTIIENNHFDNCGNAVIKWGGEVAQQPAKFTTIVRNNVITNTKIGIMNTASNNEFITINNQFSNVETNSHGNGFSNTQSKSSTIINSTSSSTNTPSTSETSSETILSEMSNATSSDVSKNTSGDIIVATKMSGSVRKPLYFNVLPTVNSKEISSYDWNFDNGNTISTKATEAVKTYSSKGTYKVTVVATDISGKEYTDTVTVNIN